MLLQEMYYKYVDFIDDRKNVIVCSVIVICILFHYFLTPPVSCAWSLDQYIIAIIVDILPAFKCHICIGIKYHSNMLYQGKSLLPRHEVTFQNLRTRTQVLKDNDNIYMPN
jgi:hypothetical protein